MRKKKSIIGRVISLIFLILAIIGVIKAYNIYKTQDFNNFIRAEKYPYSSSFLRDKEVKFGIKDSYKIQSNRYNDAIFYETIDVKPQTSYKVTCMVKTKDVEKLENNFGGGAQIAIEGTTERSKALSGTNDWTKLVLYFNSKNRTQVNIGFRLGGYDNSCTGSAWFSDITLEEGETDNTDMWEFVCFIFKNIDVNINQTGSLENYKFSIDEDEVQMIREDMQRFKETCEDFSKKKMKINYDIIEIEEPITSISYDSENAYYVNPTDVESIIEKYISKKEYDHIFSVIKLGDASQRREIRVNDWIGLGGMDYQNIGFSNIRLPNDKKNYIYRYSQMVNKFPEEVFIHEFIHSLERNLIEYGYDIPKLHDYEKYGYKNEKLISLRNWYKDYMEKNIDYNGTKIGLDPIVYSIKPVHESDFQYAYSLEIAKEPENIIEEIQAIFNNFLNVASKLREINNLDTINEK